MTSPERVKVVVIGAGQAGLSVAFYLRRFELVADEDFVMLDRAPVRAVPGSTAGRRSGSAPRTG